MRERFLLIFLLLLGIDAFVGDFEEDKENFYVSENLGSVGAKCILKLLTKIDKKWAIFLLNWTC